MVVEPTAFTTTRAPTSKPDRVVTLAEPRPPLKFTVLAPYPPPTVPSGNRPAAADSAACQPRSQYGGMRPQFLSPPFRRSNTMACEAIGTFADPMRTP